IAFHCSNGPNLIRDPATVIYKSQETRAKYGGIRSRVVFAKCQLATFIVASIYHRFFRRFSAAAACSKFLLAASLAVRAIFFRMAPRSRARVGGFAQCYGIARERISC